MDFGTGLVEVRDIAKPCIQADVEVLIKVRTAGICGTDVHVWQDKFMYLPPVTLGHEFTGKVVEIGKKCRKSRLKTESLSSRESRHAGSASSADPDASVYGEMDAGLAYKWLYG